MSNELFIWYPTGATLYAHVLNATGQVWNGATFEVPQDANWLDYDLAMTEAGTTGYYRADMPGAAAGNYSFVVFLQAGVGPVVGDVATGAGRIQWNGSAEIPTSSLSTLTAAQVWAYVTRTLTQSAAEVQAIVEGSAVNLYQNTSWNFSLTGLGDISTRSRLYFTAKSNLDALDASTATILQVEETDGLIYIGGAAAASALMGTLTVDNATLGNITVTVDDSVTGLANQHGFYDVKMVTAAGLTQVLTISTFQIKSIVTKAII